MTLHECFSQWDHHRPEYGVADYLRCAAMSAMESGHDDRGLFVKEAAARGCHRATASRCWYFVLAQNTPKPSKGAPHGT